MKTFNTAVICTQGNVVSMSNSLDDIRVEHSILNPCEEWESFNRVIVPGVGNILAYSTDLNNQSFPERVKAYLKKKDNRLLGVCVGYQYLSLGSEESSDAACLSLLPIYFSRLPINKLIRIPHVGWNTLKYSNGVVNDQYFTHSYAALLGKYDNNVALSDATEYATSFYGNQFISFFRKQNVFGVQSHPEKSRQTGLNFLSRFIRSE
jgi:glutamine amidotransferase